MYVVYRDATHLNVHANTPQDKIDWLEAAQGRGVFLMTRDDFQTIYDWVNAGHYVGEIAPEQVPDAEMHNPGDEGYVPTWSSGTPSHWELLGNTACMKTGGSVELHNADSSLSNTLTADQIIVDVT